MKLKQMVEKLTKEGMVSGTAKAQLLQAAEEMEKRMAEMQKELEDMTADLEKDKLTAAVERAILEAGGKNVKAIMALIDMDQVAYDEEEGLTGLDMEELKAEAPYLFHEKAERKKGTGATKSSRKKKEDEIREAFRRGLGR